MANKKTSNTFFKPNLKKKGSPLKITPFKLKVPSYLTSHSKPQKLRKYIGSKKTLSKMDKIKVIPFLMVGKPKHIKKKDLSWPQAKRRFPKLKPMVDTDRDGVKNMFDCKPFDRKRQGFKHQYSFSFSDYPKTRTIKMSPNEFLRNTWEEGGKTSVYGDPNVTKEERMKQVSLQEYKKQLQDLDRKSIDYLKDKIKSKEDQIAIGFIEMRDGKPSGHEGRHTAIAAEELGIKKIPVTIETSEEEDIEDYEPVRETLQAEYAQEKKDEDWDKSHGYYEGEPIEFPFEEED